MKLDGVTGEVLWSSGYESVEGVSESVYDMVLDAAGNAYITGRALIAPNGFQFITIKFSAASGAILWMDTRGGTDLRDDVAWSIVLDSDGHPVVTGMYGLADGSADYYTAKLNASNGDLIWDRQEPGAVNNQAEAGWLVALPGGDVVMCNRTWTATTSYDVVLRRYAASDGATVWQRQWGSGGSTADDPRGMALAADGSPLVCGVTAGDYLVLKLDPADGTTDWWTSYDGPPGWYDVANVVGPGPGGSVLVSGYSSGQTTGWDVATCALDPDTGDELWVQRFDAGLGYTDEAYGLAYSTTGEVAVVGYGYGASTNNDLLTLLYQVDLATPVGDLPARALDLSAYPNPFNPSVEFRFEVQHGAALQLSIYDGRGHLVSVLHDGYAAAGPLIARWDGRDAAGRGVPSGVYLARLTGRDVHALRKVVLAK